MSCCSPTTAWEQQAVLDTTHAFAGVSAQYGHRIAAAAFESARVPVSPSWQAASDHLPILVPATATSAAGRPRRPTVWKRSTAVCGADLNGVEVVDGGPGNGADQVLPGWRPPST